MTREPFVSLPVKALRVSSTSKRQLRTKSRAKFYSKSVYNYPNYTGGFHNEPNEKANRIIFNVLFMLQNGQLILTVTVELRIFLISSLWGVRGSNLTFPFLCNYFYYYSIKTVLRVSSRESNLQVSCHVFSAKSGVIFEYGETA